MTQSHYAGLTPIGEILARQVLPRLRPPKGYRRASRVSALSVGNDIDNADGSDDTITAGQSPSAD